ncbi:MAG TPA: hypothetical protein VMN79_02325 [Casimicrobiaceae bacterium]|nr:hypothetical protein [Casimicrobiaceae bacterium]
MSLVALQLGPLDVPGFDVHRSGIRWLCDDGHHCRPGEVIAFCNIGLLPAGKSGAAAPAPADETLDFQVAFAPRAGGQLRKSPDSSRGGFHDLLHFYQRWTPEFAIGHLEPSPAGEPVECEPNGGLRMLMLAGRRPTGLAVDRSGLLTGWHDRCRAWWGDGDASHGTLLSLGICELLGVIRGDKFAFLELFEATAGPAHAVFVPDHTIAPCAALLSEQVRRDPAQSQALAASFTQSLQLGVGTPDSRDWIFAGTLLSALLRSPLSDRYHLLTRSGFRQAAQADAVILSINSESPSIFRHRRLGYALQCHTFRLMHAGPAFRRWLETDFSRVQRTIDDIRRDYAELIDTVRQRSPMQFLILNAVSTSVDEDVHCYAPYDAPLGNVLTSVRTKDLNLMLHDLAREKDVSIVDIDAIAADLGAAHVPDAMHFSGLMQNEVRDEILRILRTRGVPGFGPRSVK